MSFQDHHKLFFTPLSELLHRLPKKVVGGWKIFYNQEEFDEFINLLRDRHRASGVTMTYIAANRHVANWLNTKYCKLKNN